MNHTWSYLIFISYLLHVVDWPYVAVAVQALRMRRLNGIRIQHRLRLLEKRKYTLEWHLDTLKWRYNLLLLCILQSWHYCRSLSYHRKKVDHDDALRHDLLVWERVDTLNIITRYILQENEVVLVVQGNFKLLLEWVLLCFNSL